MNQLFEGDFKRRPQQDLSGASTKISRLDVIHKAQLERQKREENRRNIKSSICIQKCFRSYLIRKQFKQNCRLTFEHLQLTYSQTVADDENLVKLNQLSNYFIFFYQSNQDYEKLIWICQQIIKEKNKVINKMNEKTEFDGIVWRFRIKRLLEFCLNSIKMKSNRGVALRMIDIFISLDRSLQSIQISLNTYLIKKEYFKKLREFLIDTSSYESNPSLRQDLCKFLLKPIEMIERRSEENLEMIDYSNLAFNSFCKYILCNKLPDDDDTQFLTYLIKSNQQKRFPIVCFYQYLTENYSQINMNVYLFYIVLNLVPNISTSTEAHSFADNYLFVLSKLSTNIGQLQFFNKKKCSSVKDDEDEDEEMEVSASDEELLISKCIELINEEDFILIILNNIIGIGRDASHRNNTVNKLSTLYFNLILIDKNASQKFRLLYTLAFKRDLLRLMWDTKENDNILLDLRKGQFMLITDDGQSVNANLMSNVYRLTTFCELFNVLLQTLHDDEFFSLPLDCVVENSSPMPFSVAEVIEICNTLKNFVEAIIDVLCNANAQMKRKTINKYQFDKCITYWTVLYKSVTKLLTNLYNKNSRKKFCDDDFWYGRNIFNFPREDQPIQIEHTVRLFDQIDKAPHTSCETRWIKVLNDVPYLIPFMSRVLLFRALMKKQRDQNQNSDHSSGFLQFQNFSFDAKNVHYTIRRSHIYEDSFDKIQETNILDRFRIVLINEAGVKEAGVDGGGVFREFMYELLKACFDPNRGFFILNKENQLYPNPNIGRIYDNPFTHYFFIGMILGKALYENIQVDLPMAEFFLVKLISEKSNIDLHYLASLDQLLYKNMLYLKNYDRDVQELALDFSLVNQEFGDNVTYNLIPNGNNVAVTNLNKIEYMHLLADFKINKQIAKQCAAFKTGLYTVINPTFLRFFSVKELQLLISGPDSEIDIDDLQMNTNYAYSTTADDPTVVAFWEIVRTFTSEQKRQLLKFVTSCSRAPLLGFREFDPPFTINVVEATSCARFPTASTCINYLKIPRILDKNILRERLLFSISQAQGFELS